MASWEEVLSWQVDVNLKDQLKHRFDSVFEQYDTDFDQQYEYVLQVYPERLRSSLPYTELFVGLVSRLLIAAHTAYLRDIDASVYRFGRSKGVDSIRSETDKGDIQTNIDLRTLAIDTHVMDNIVGSCNQKLSWDMDIVEMHPDRLLSLIPVAMGFLSKHREQVADTALFEYNIKLQDIKVPLEIERILSEEGAELFWSVVEKYANRLVAQVTGLDWVEDAWTAGRSGGWLQVSPVHYFSLYSIFNYYIDIVNRQDPIAKAVFVGWVEEMLGIKLVCDILVKIIELQDYVKEFMNYAEAELAKPSTWGLENEQ